MLKDREGNLRIYSLAIVLEDKDPSSDYVVCHPIEELPLIDGNVADWKLDYNVTLPDVSGVKKTSNVQMDSKIKARWLQLGQSNRVTSPDLIKNETIILFRYADTDEYWWTTIFHEPSIRRLETVRYEFGNTQSGDWSKEKKNCYSLEVSTREKLIWLQTVNSDGEPFSYDIKINTGEGVLTILDSNENMIKLWSSEKRIGLKASTLDIDVDTMNVRGNANIHGGLNVSEAVNMQQGLNVKGSIASPSSLKVPICTPGCAASGGPGSVGSMPGNSFPLSASLD